MNGYQESDFAGVTFSVAFTGELDRHLAAHLDKGLYQEDLVFAYWKPSRGAKRYTAILMQVVMPVEGDRVLQGNVAFTADYLGRVQRECPEGYGIALLHSHPVPGWQDMSDDDEFAEGIRLGGSVANSTGHPVLGLTRGTDGSWSARFWLRSGPRKYTRHDCETVRVAAVEALRITYHPALCPPPAEQPTQVATVSVWGAAAQADLARTRVGIVGLGSVGGIIAEALNRLGIENVTYIDHDIVEARNLDRTLNARPKDVDEHLTKVAIAKRAAEVSHTAGVFHAEAVPASILTPEGLAAALDCDVLLSCVDRPWPRAILNIIAYGHLIPVVDGGILARTDKNGRPLHVDWRIHTVTAGRACLYCLSALLRSDVALERAGKLDDPDYFANLPEADRERYARRNVFPFSLAVAGHQTLQLVGIVTGMPRVGGKGPQHYSVYPGEMRVNDVTACDPACEIQPITGTALALDDWLKATESA